MVFKRSAKIHDFGWHGMGDNAQLVNPQSAYADSFFAKGAFDSDA
jgi:hypothetical protein